MASKKKRGSKPRAKTRSKAKTGAKKAKRAPARKRAPVKVARARSQKAAKPATEEQSFPLIIDEVLEESLLDVSTILRVKDGVARSQRDVDEDERKQFPDPSIVIEAQTRNPRREEDDTDEFPLPELFAAEARLQKARAADSPAPKRHDGSLFGSLGSDASKEDVDPEED